MKKNLFLIGLAFLANCTYAQTIVVDTLDEHFKNSTATNYPVLMGPVKAGYLGGYSLYEDRAKAQLFDSKYGVTGDGQITELLFWFAFRSGNPSSTIIAKIWSDNAGKPGSVLSSATILFKDIPTIYTPVKTLNASYNTVVKLPSPITIPSNKKFWAGFTMYVTPAAMAAGDTVALFTSKDPVAGDSPGISGDFPDVKTHTFDLLRNGTTWISTNDSTGNSYQMDIAYAVFPVVSFTVGMDEKENNMGLKLFQNYPNPFSNTTEITYELNKPSKNVSLEITDIVGRKIMEFKQREQLNGVHSVSVNAGKLSKGIYFYTLKTGDAILTKRMIINSSLTIH